MTPEQIELVQRAWGKVTALNHTYVQEVYEELFRLSPELIDLFPDPAGMPVAKVSETLNTVITSLEQLDALGFIIRDLGRRHRKFKVEPHQFALLKQALTTVLARRLGANFKPELAEAWSQMYDEIAALMLEGLNQHAESTA
ncbi:globin domain-containing protein [Aeromonas encheleia]|uniref:globin domain-containing protein n=1 Tax=Aeromonas TaxID=642 RepID=UPI001C488E6A|nr:MULTISPECIES: globin domain-containing protein [Aeromonas]MBV7436029.1 globin [Aeromonas sp. sif2416]UNP87427.1 globin domain-containing protein [Aeromonas encheleia]